MWLQFKRSHVKNGRLLVPASLLAQQHSSLQNHIPRGYKISSTQRLHNLIPPEVIYLFISLFDRDNAVKHSYRAKFAADVMHIEIIAKANFQLPSLEGTGVVTSSHPPRGYMITSLQRLHDHIPPEITWSCPSRGDKISSLWGGELKGHSFRDFYRMLEPSTRISFPDSSFELPTTFVPDWKTVLWFSWCIRDLFGRVRQTDRQGHGLVDTWS